MLYFTNFNLKLKFIYINYKIVLRQPAEKAAPQVGGAKTIFQQPVENKINEKKAAPEVDGAAFPKNLGGAGRPKEHILMTINTFKKLCLKSNTKKADEIHDYFIKLEESLQETINEESNELRFQLQHKEQLLIEHKEQTELEKEELLEKTLLSQFPLGF